MTLIPEQRLFATPARAQDTGVARYSKRAVDIALTCLLLSLLWPILLVSALAIRLSGSGPIFYVQRRVGRGGVVFNMVKFRTMRVNAPALGRDMSDRAGPVFKCFKDPRITRVGRLLRRLSIDELPQLFNVLRGDMSLVGPRPATPEEVALYPVHALERLNVLPGLTGLWQVSGRADVGFDDMIEMDLAYMRKSSLWFDLRLLAATVGAVITGRGAY